MSKKPRFDLTNAFNLAYKEWTGIEWQWEGPDGSPNHPMDSGDNETKAFYMGFRYSQIEKLKISREIKAEQTELKKRMREVDAKIEKMWRK